MPKRRCLKFAPRVSRRHRNPQRLASHFRILPPISNGSSGSKPLAFFLERYADAYRIELESFVDCILGRGELLANENDGVRALELAEGVIQSSKTGRAVAV